MIYNPYRSNVAMSVDMRNLRLSNASLFNPPGHLATAISVFRDLVNKDLHSLQIKKNRREYTFKKGLEMLKDRDDIIVRPTDKGGGGNCHS